MDEQRPISQDAYNDLLAEIERLESEDRARIADKIRFARAEGDLSENAEYHAAKNEQAFLETKILKLRDQLQNSVVVESSGNGDEVEFGSKVKLFSLESEKEVEFTIVSSFDQDVSKGLLSSSSPIGSALLGTAKDETIEVKLPNGKVSKFKVLEIN